MASSRFNLSYLIVQLYAFGRSRALITPIGVGLAGAAGMWVVGNAGVFDYLDARSAFSLGESRFVDFSGNDPRWKAMLVGLINTVSVGITALVLATLIGVIVGLARRSGHWPTRQLADFYVQAFRSTPLLIQVLFWYLVIILNMPALTSESTPILGVLAFTNRAIAIPSIAQIDPVISFSVLIALAGAVFGWVIVRRVTATRDAGSDRNLHPNLSGFVAFLVIGVGLYALLGRGLTLSVPDFETIGESGPTIINGGWVVSAEFLAIVAAVSFERAAHIGEEVRAALDSVHQGQLDAARTLGLSRSDTFFHVVGPQVLASAIPRISSHYQTLIKSTPVALAIAYPELVSVSKTVVNNGGALVATFIVVSGAYLLLSLLISSSMVAWNRSTTPYMRSN